MVFLFFFAFFFLLSPARPEERPATNEPRFLSEGGHKWVKEGEDIELECVVEDLGEFVILWKVNKSQVLFAGNLRIHRDDRISRDDRTGSLKIRDFRPEIGGEYMCQVSTNPPQDIVYSVALIGPPRIRAQPEKGQIVTENETISLFCETNAETIEWKKYENNGSRTLRTEGPRLEIGNAQRSDAGIYECVAENRIGNSGHNFSVQVFYSPQLHVSVPLVHAAIGQSVQIGCTILAEPTATVVWFANNGKVVPGDNFRFGRQEMTATLTIGNVTRDHYSNYSCVANNSLGSALTTIQVTGRPSIPLVLSPVLGGRRTSYDVIWTLESSEPISNYELRLRRVDGDTNWQHFSVAPSHVTSGPERRERFLLENLLLDSNYELEIWAENMFGVTQSEVFLFVTSSSAERPIILFFFFISFFIYFLQ